MGMINKYNNALNCNYNNTGDTEYRLDIDHKLKRIELSFAGSSEFIVDGKIGLDWISNFNFMVKPYKHMKYLFFVHRGIHKKYMSVRDEIYEQVKGLIDYTMHIYGFSQGGGIDYSAHEDYWFRGFDPETWAFAPPRAFGWWNSRVLKKRFLKFHVVKNVNDVVPKAPPVIFGFRHYGTIHKLGKWKITFPWQWYKEHMGYRKLIKE